MVEQHCTETLTQTRVPRRPFGRIGITLLGTLCIGMGWSCYSARKSTTGLRPDPALSRNATPQADRAAVAGTGATHGQSNADADPHAWANRSDDRTRAQAGPANARPSAVETVAQRDERFRRLLLGDWEDDYRGKRYLTLRDDGTATMLVEPAGIGKTLFAPQLTFNIDWKVEAGRLHMKTLGGEPKGKVQFVLKMYGDHAVQPIQDLTDERLQLLDEDGVTKYNWRRSTNSPLRNAVHPETDKTR